jgi:hypothetical protein
LRQAISLPDHANVNASAGNEKGASAREKIGAKTLPRKLAGLLELVVFILTRFDQSGLPVGRVDRDRGQ